MFRQVSTPVLGVIENMTGYVCPSCGTEDAVVPVLARIPIAPPVREGGDLGQPIVVADPAHPVSRSFETLAARVADEVRRGVHAPAAGVSA
jgi:ATP-binding protein involved in chromosome partitioning